MRIKKKVFLLLLPFIAELLIACCDCAPITEKTFTHCSLLLAPLDNSGAAPAESQTNSISREAFGIRLTLSRKNSMCRLIPRTGLLTSSAYATSCCEDELQYTFKDNVEEIVIYSVNDFAPDKPAGADVTEYFFVYRPDNHKNEFTGLSYFVENMYPTVQDINNPDLTLDLLLMTPPATGTEHKFKVHVLLSDGRRFMEETKVIHLVP